MKKIIVALLAVVVLMSFTACNARWVKVEDVTLKYSNNADRAAGRAEQLASNMLDEYVDQTAYNLNRNDSAWEMYIMKYYNPFTDEASDIASVWHVTSVLAMTNRVAEIMPKGSVRADKYLTYSDDIISELSWYRGSGSITTYRESKTETLYGVNRGRVREGATVTGDKSVYDDQMWLIRELISAYQNTGNIEYLNEAERLSNVCINGWDYSTDKNGNEYGGIPWGPYYASMHTCSNAPIIEPLVDLYTIFKDSDATVAGRTEKKSDYYLDWAKKIYGFMYNSTLRNANGTYGDAYWTDRQVVTENGVNRFQTTRINNTDSKTYTYNTGAMVGGAAALYAVTEDSKYLDDALISAEGAFNEFIKKAGKDQVYNQPCVSTLWFNFVLLEGYTRLYPHAKTTVLPYIQAFEQSLDYSYENYYYNGFLPVNLVEGWVYGENTKDTKKDVMDAAATAEMYALISQFYSSLV